MPIRTALTLILLLLPASTLAQECVSCHKKATPLIVADWEQSRHNDNAITCDMCHGSGHSGEKDVDKAAIPTPKTCSGCHPERVEQFSRGKHAKAWEAVVIMPTTHFQPMVLLEGKKGCTGCHKIGLKDQATLQRLKDEGEGFGVAACDSCHTRHAFSLKEARSPQACRTCHMGFDHPQWEMYESSKHGVRYLLQQSGVVDKTLAAPTCQTCHMKDGDHAVMTGWGFLGVRLPMPDDPQWEKDRTTLFKALGVLDLQGKPTDRFEAAQKVDLLRTSQKRWQELRNEMLSVCSRCHSENFARGELEKGDRMIRQVDRLMAEAIGIVAGLYRDGLLEKPESYARAYPDLLAFHDAPTEIELRLFLMFLKHRMRAFQGAFHMNPDYTLWYGWSEMTRDLTSIRVMADEMRAKAGSGKNTD